jgi:exopolysaccharide biosynthesis WecB/TagA/CpsF family protein
MYDVSSKLVDGAVTGKLHTFINPYSYFVLRNHQGLIDSIDRVLVDGQLLVSVFRFLGVATLKRKSFDMTSLALDIFSLAVKNTDTVYLVGTTPSAIKVAVENITDRFSGLIVSGYHHGYLDDEIIASEVIADIVSKSPDIVVVGMGAPRQEQFLLSLRAAGWAGTGYTCGGFFHQTASSIDYYPRWADKLNLRWLYRIYDEPKLAKRYFMQYPLALCLIVYDFKIKPIFAKN